MSESNQPVAPVAPTVPSPRPFPVIVAGSILIGLSIVGALVCLIVLIAMDQSDQIAPALSTCGVCLVGSLITLWPMHRAARQSVQQLPMAALGGTVIRLAVAVAGGAGLVGLIDLAFTPVALWTLGWYLLFLMVDVAILTRYFRRLGEAGSL